MSPTETEVVESRLYHRDVYLPKCLRRPIFQGPLSYTWHAKQAAQRDRLGVIPLPERFSSHGAFLIEVETVNGFPVKQVWRIPLDKKLHLVMVITVEGTVKTVWLNRSSDRHCKLKTDIYQKERIFT